MSALSISSISRMTRSCLPQLALLDVVLHVVDLVHAKLRITQPADRVVFVEALVGLGGGLDVPGDEFGAEGFGQLLGQHGLAGARFALYQQGALQGDGGVDREFQVVGGDVGLGAFEFHCGFLRRGLARRRSL